MIDLAHFTATAEWHVSHRALLGAPALLLTDGTKYVADTCKAYWLFDIVWSVGLRLRTSEGAYATLARVGNGAFFSLVSLEDGRIIHPQQIPHTDFFKTFPDDTFTFKVVRQGMGPVIACLHSED